MNNHRQWDQRDLTELLSLEPISGGSWRSYVCDANIHGQVSDSQLLGQTLWAAAQSCEGRRPASLQMTFLRSATPQQAVEFSSDTLRDGQHLSRRLVHGVQGAALVLSANASFQALQAEAAPVQPLPRLFPTPESLPALPLAIADDQPRNSHLQLRCSTMPLLDIRPIPSDEGHRDFGYWMRLVPPLDGEGVLHHAALAYLSGSWLPAHLSSPPDATAGQHCPVHALNHSLWFYSPTVDANEWMLFSSEVIAGSHNRSLAKTNIYRRDGRLIASMAQDLLAVARTT